MPLVIVPAGVKLPGYPGALRKPVLVASGKPDGIPPETPSNSMSASAGWHRRIAGAASPMRARRRVMITERTSHAAAEAGQPEVKLPRVNDWPANEPWLS
jgi:hypothetical protein